MKKVLNIALVLLIMVYMILSLSFTNGRENELLCNDIQIDMGDTLTSGFLVKKDIENMILREESGILGYPVSKINTRNLENKLRYISYIKKAEVYYDLEGILSVKIVQRKPVVRVMTQRGNSYYIDNEGYIIKPRRGFTPHIIICNGYFSEGGELQSAKTLSELSDNPHFSEWEGALKLALYIDDDKFWKSQIVQIFMNKKGEFEVIPRVGAHQILLGNADNIGEKFDNLMILYKDGLDYEGWNKYNKINLKYKNQVICTKR